MRLVKKLVLALFTFLFLGIGVTSCTIEEPEFKTFEGIEVTKVENEQAEIILQFSMNNPNPKDIKLSQAQIDISVNHLFMGTATLLEPVTLPANGTHQIALKMNLEMEKSIAEMAVGLGFAVLTNSLEIQFKGVAKGKMGWFSKTFEIDQAQKVDWKDLQKMDI
jgi:LEA14-like dessication related protein